MALLRDDLAWQEGRAQARPGDPVGAEAMADDRRRLAYAAESARDPAAQRAALDEEAATLRRSAVEDPANLKWQRFLVFNVRGWARLLAEAGDAAGGAAKAREASARAPPPCWRMAPKTRSSAWWRSGRTCSLRCC